MHEFFSTDKATLQVRWFYFLAGGYFGGGTFFGIFFLVLFCLVFHLFVCFLVCVLDFFF